MRIKRKNRRSVIHIVAAMTGDIIYSDNGAEPVMQAGASEYNLYDILDADYILRLSMTSASILYVDTKIQGFGKGIASVVGSGIGRRIEIMLISDEASYKAESLGLNMEKTVEVLSDAEDKPCAASFADLVADSIGGAIHADFINKAVSLVDRDIKVVTEPLCFALLLLNSMHILSEISGGGQIKITASTEEYGKRLLLSAPVADGEELFGIYDLSAEYPCVSLYTAFTRALCNERGIELTLRRGNGEIQIGLTFPSGNIAEFPVYNRAAGGAADGIKRALSVIFANGIKNL